MEVHVNFDVPVASAEKAASEIWNAKAVQQALAEAEEMSRVGLRGASGQRLL